MSEQEPVKQQSELLAMAESYYIVARNMEMQGRKFLEMSELLSGMADRMCELNMDNHSKTKQATAGLP